MLPKERPKQIKRKTRMNPGRKYPNQKHRRQVHHSFSPSRLSTHVRTFEDRSSSREFDCRTLELAMPGAPQGTPIEQPHGPEYPYGTGPPPGSEYPSGKYYHLPQNIHLAQTIRMAQRLKFRLLLRHHIHRHHRNRELRLGTPKQSLKIQTRGRRTCEIVKR